MRKVAVNDDFWEKKRLSLGLYLYRGSKYNRQKILMDTEELETETSLMSKKKWSGGQ